MMLIKWTFGAAAGILRVPPEEIPPLVEQGDPKGVPEGGMMRA
jgi:hypothetical protein